MNTITKPAGRDASLKDIHPYPLTESQIEAYRQDGFIQLIDVFTGPLLAELRDAVASAVSKEVEEEKHKREPNRPKSLYENIFTQRVNLWTRHPSVSRFALSPYLGNIAARLEGCPMRMWHDQALFKEPHGGNNRTPWHQDAVYWPHSAREHQTSIWIALQDATIHNGCMSFVGGTHKLGALPPVDLADPKDIFAYVPHIKPVKPKTIELKAGSATFHNGLTFHYAGPNKSEGVREAFTIIYMPDGALYDGKPHRVTDPLHLTSGVPLDGDLFPILSTL